MSYLILLITTTIIALLAIGIICLNSNSENASAQKEYSEIPPRVEQDKNITIMAMEKYYS